MRQKSVYPMLDIIEELEQIAFTKLNLQTFFDTSNCTPRN